MIAFQHSHGVLVVHSDEQDRAVVLVIPQVIAQRLDLGDEVPCSTSEGLALDALDDVFQQEAAVSNPPPLGSGKHPHAVEVLRLDLYFPPLRVSRQLSPHVAAATKQQSPAQG